MSLLRLLRGAFVAAAVVATGASPAAAQATGVGLKLDPVLRARARQLTGRSRVIVQFAGDPDVRVFSGRGVSGRRLAARAHTGEVDNRSLAQVADDPRVLRVMVDRPVFATLERTSAAVGAVAARQQTGTSGRGIGIAVVDSGITTWHDDLYRSGSRFAPRVVHFKDFTRASSSTLWTTELPSDEYGHGTHVAGIIAGTGYDSGGARRGIAPGAHLVGLKVLDGDGHGFTSDVIAAIDYAISVRAAYNIRVINLSVAAGVFESYWQDPLTLAARRATQAGIVVVAAAGNLGRNDAGEPQFGGITSPGNAPWVLTVGASSHQGTAARHDDVIGGFSSRGPTWIDFSAKPDLVAPGVGIESLSDPHSALYSSLPGYRLPGTVPLWYKPYLSLSGTSMAAPVVSGAVALMLEANPALTPNAVKAILQYTAQARAGEHILAQGAGLLNASGAVRLARYFAAPQNRLGPMADTIASEPIRWARHIIWGNYRVTGGMPLPGSNAWAAGLTWGALETAGGTPVVWGAVDDENIVWSTGDDENIVWSTRAGGENIVWSTQGGNENIVWSTAPAGDDENIVWSTSDDDENIVWSTAVARNVVWGDDCGGRNCRKTLWGAGSGAAVWGTAADGENIVWSTSDDENIVWSTSGDDENIVWSTGDDENIVWSTGAAAPVLWPAAPRGQTR